MSESTNRIIVFTAVVYAISWVAAAVYFFVVGELGGMRGLAFGAGYMLLPGLCGAALAKWRDGESVLDKLGFRSGPQAYSPWWAAAWLLPVACMVLATAASALVPGASVGLSIDVMVSSLAEFLPADQVELAREQLEAMPVHPVLIMVGQGLIAGPTVNAVFALGEEAGWRGYLYDESRALGFWTCSGLTGVIWGVWHAPLILMGHNYPDHSVAGVGMMVLFTLGLSPLHTLVRDKIGVSFAPAVLHGTINATAGISIILVTGGSDLTVGVTGAAGIAALGVINLAVFWSGVWRSGE